MIDEALFAGPFRILQLRYASADGFHRETRAPGSDMSDLPKEIQAQAAKEWTDEVRAAYAESLVLPEVKRTVLKSVVVSRLIEAGLIETARAALDRDASAYARWWAPDRPAINHDDPDALALLKAIGADPEVILAP